MNSLQMVGLGLAALSLLLLFPSLWENLPQWRTPRKTEEGIFHTLRAGLLVVFHWSYWWLFVLMYRLGVRGWVVYELPLLLIPVTLRRAAAAAYFEYAVRRDASKVDHHE